VVALGWLRCGHLSVRSLPPPPVIFALLLGMALNALSTGRATHRVSPVGRSLLRSAWHCWVCVSLHQVGELGWSYGALVIWPVPLTIVLAGVGKAFKLDGPVWCPVRRAVGYAGRLPLWPLLSRGQ